GHRSKDNPVICGFIITKCYAQLVWDVLSLFLYAPHLNCGARTLSHYKGRDEAFTKEVLYFRGQSMAVIKGNNLQSIEGSKLVRECFFPLWTHVVTSIELEAGP